MTEPTPYLDLGGLRASMPAGWDGDPPPLPLTRDSLAAALLRLENPFFLLTDGREHFIASHGALSTPTSTWSTLAFCPPFTSPDLGDPDFRRDYGLAFPLYGGSMANGISSEEFVIAMGRAGYMGSYGAGGVLPARLEQAIQNIQQALPGGPFAFNLINSPLEPALEQRAAELYIRHGIRVVEASAYLTLTPALVLYRASGLTRSPDGTPIVSNRIIAKLSRKEVALQFLQPAPAEILAQLVSEGSLTPAQAELARLVPMADDITVEADSGGHTDGRPLVSVLPAIIQLRDSLETRQPYPWHVRVGAAGGISTPSAALAAFMMGAAYVATGSVNQSCVESAASEHTKSLLATAEMTDVAMAPASDMFEMGARVQVLRRGTMFAMRAQKLYELYQRYESLEDIPPPERDKLESTIFKRSLDDVWQECIRFFSERDPRQIERASQKPRDRMALVFRWYLGLSSRWSNNGEKGREMDYQIWCGPAMGAFNDWVRGTYLEPWQERRAADVSRQILTGAAYLYRVRMLESQGLCLASGLSSFTPV